MVANIKTNIERLSFPLLVIFTTLASILAIGDFNRSLAIQDTSTSGIFNTNLLLYPEIYQNDIIKYLTPLGYLNPIVMMQYFLKLIFNVNPFYSSYFFLVLANIVFVTGFYKLSKVFLEKKSLSAIATLISLGIVIQDNNLSVFGPGTSFQVFPDMNFYALGVICLFLASILKEKLFRSLIFLQILIFTHLGHALLILPVFYIYLFTKAIIFKEQRAFLSKMFFSSLICLISIFFLLSLNFINVSDSVSNEHIFSFLAGTVGGHIYPWENETYFSIVLNYLAVFFAFIIILRNSDKLTKSFWMLFLSLLSIVFVYFLIHFFILHFEIISLVRFVQLLPLRSSVYIQLLILPFILGYFLTSLSSVNTNIFVKILFFSILILMGSHKSFFSWVLLNSNYLDLANFILIKIIFSVFLIISFLIIKKMIFTQNINLSMHFIALLFSGFITLESFNFFYGSKFANDEDREFVTLLRWMNQETTEDSKFITIDYHIQINGISNRSTYRPFPFIPELYRSQEAEAEIFSNEILEYWGISKKLSRGWFDNQDKQNIYDLYYKLSEGEIIDMRKKTNSNFFITTQLHSKLNFPIVYKNNMHIIYKID